MSITGHKKAALRQSVDQKKLADAAIARLGNASVRYTKNVS
jgi:hypothetical protein